MKVVLLKQVKVSFLSRDNAYIDPTFESILPSSTMYVSMTYISHTYPVSTIYCL